MVAKKMIFMALLLSSLLRADIFEKGHSNFGVSLGTSSSYTKSYTLVGLNANYFIIDNLSLGILYRGWFGANPMQNEVAVATDYFLPLSKKFRPYLGGFIRETFVDGYDTYESYGARGGVAIITNNTFVSLGYAYEQYSKCLFSNECSASYPEISFGFSF